MAVESQNARGFSSGAEAPSGGSLYVGAEAPPPKTLSAAPAVDDARLNWGVILPGAAEMGVEILAYLVDGTSSARTRYGIMTWWKMTGSGQTFAWRPIWPPCGLIHASFGTSPLLRIR
jgi:hypothetical protein